jgi:hypothetical protein
VDPEARQSFSKIKNALTQDPMLISPNFEKDFQIYSFASEHTVVGALHKRMKKVLSNL